MHTYIILGVAMKEMQGRLELKYSIKKTSKAQEDKNFL